MCYESKKNRFCLERWALSRNSFRWVEDVEEVCDETRAFYASCEEDEVDWGDCTEGLEEASSIYIYIFTIFGGNDEQCPEDEVAHRHLCVIVAFIATRHHKM